MATPIKRWVTTFLALDAVDTQTLQHERLCGNKQLFMSFFGELLVIMWTIEGHCHLTCQYWLLVSKCGYAKLFHVLWCHQQPCNLNRIMALEVVKNLEEIVDYLCMAAGETPKVWLHIFLSLSFSSSFLFSSFACWRIFGKLWGKRNNPSYHLTLEYLQCGQQFRNLKQLDSSQWEREAAWWHSCMKCLQGSLSWLLHVPPSDLRSQKNLLGAIQELQSVLTNCWTLKIGCNMQRYEDLPRQHNTVSGSCAKTSSWV